jgi:hypothetical protein
MTNMLKYTLFLLAFALDPAAIASPNPTSRLKAAEPSSLPADWRQPLTLMKDSAPELTAQAEPQGNPAALSGVPSEAEKTAELAKEAQNPIANLISLPFQNNTNFGDGPKGQRTKIVLNIQPVIPVPLSKDLLLVTRTILPYIYQPTSASGNEGEFGLCDINPSFFLVPRTTSKITWGVGPSFVLPRPHNRSPARANGALAQPVSSWSPQSTLCSALWPTMSGPLLDQGIASRSISF